MHRISRCFGSLNTAKNLASSNVKYAKSFARPTVLSSKLILKAFGGLSIFVGTGYLLSRSEKPISFMDNLVDKCVEKSENLLEGQMKEVVVGDDSENDTIIICRVDGKVYAVASKCSHYNVNLKWGNLYADRIYCPAHMASFSVITGLPDGGPVFDALTTYECREENGNIYVKAPNKIVHKTVQKMAKRDPNNTEKYVIIGGGPAGLSAAETLRQSGYTGEIVVMSDEPDLPYDRTTLTKNVLKVTHENIVLRKNQFFEDHNIDYKLNQEVTGLDTENKKIFTKNSEEPIAYDKLLIATGSSPRTPPIEGRDLPNVFTIRKIGDMEKIKEAANKSKNIVIIGASFIGLEAASSLKDSFKGDANIVVVDMIEPFERVLGKEVGSALKGLNEENGVKFLIGKGLKKIESENNVATKILFDDNTSMPADMIILGTGVKPNTDFVKGSEVNVEKFGHLTCNVFMKTSAKDVYAAGDLASVPWFYNANRIVCEHYSNAIQQGSCAAWNMLGKNIPYDMVPMFWTRQWATNLYYTGHAMTWDRVIIDGSLKERKFLAYYIKDGRVDAVSGMGRNGDILLINQAMRLNLVPALEDFNNGKLDLAKLKVRVDENRPNCFCKRQKIIETGKPWK